MPSTTPLPSTTAQAPKAGLLKRIATKLRSPQPVASSSTAAPADKASGSKPKRRCTVLLPPVPRPKAPVPTLPNTFSSPGQREAALLARGLVPRRHRDANGDTLPMSAQEAEHDRRFTVLCDGDGSSSEGETEARRIREQWLARNVADVADVACDDGSSRVVGENTQIAGQRRASEEEMARSRSSLSAAAIDAGDDVVISKPVSPRLPRLVRSHSPSLLSPSQAELADATVSPDVDADADVDSLCLALDPVDVPLPASPATSLNSRVRWNPTSAASPRSEGRDGAHVGKGQAKGKQTTSLLTPSSPPTIFDGPHPSHDAAFLAPSSTSNSAPIPIQRGRSLATVSTATSIPALSPTRTTSSVSTSDSPNTPRPADDTPGRARSSSVASGESCSLNQRDVPKIKTSEGTPLTAMSEVIVESPTEDDDDDGDDFVPELPGLHPRKSSADHAQTVRRRGLFKRGDTTTPSSPIQKATSMGNLRRSVAGTISGKLGLRPRSTLVVDTAFATRPPVPSSHSLSPRSVSAPTPAARLDAPRPRPRPRQPLSPTMHTRGSIILYAGEIQDEESRRLSEAAFLDF